METPKETLTKHWLLIHERSVLLTMETMKILIPLNALLLTILVTFSKSYVSPQSSCKWMVAWSWVFLILALFCHLIRLIGENAAEWSYREQMRKIEEGAKNNPTLAADVEYQISKINNDPHRAFLCAAWVGVIFLLIGMGLIAAYVGANQSGMFGAENSSPASVHGSQIIINNR